SIKDTYCISASIQKKVTIYSYDISGVVRRFKSEDVSFSSPLLDITANWKYSETMELTLSGMNLLHLFEIGNTEHTGFNLVSDGTTVQEFSNRYNMNYLMIGLKYRP